MIINKGDVLSRYDLWLAGEGSTYVTKEAGIKSLIKTFLDKFTIDKVKTMSIDEYIVGKRLNNTFCYWVEDRLHESGDIRPRALTGLQKFGVYYSKKKAGYQFLPHFSRNNYEEAFEHVKEAIVKLLEDNEKHNWAGVAECSLNPLFKSKICYLYSNDTQLPIYSDKDLNVLLAEFGISFTVGEDRVYKREKLYRFYKSLGREDITPWRFMSFLYSWTGFNSELRSLDAVQLKEAVNATTAKQYSIIDVNHLVDKKGRSGLVKPESPETLEKKRLAGKKGEEVVKAYLEEHRGEMMIKGEIECACEKNDYAHYDFSFETTDGKKVYIEAKATSLDRGDAVVFEMSEAEHRFMLSHMDSYFIYYVNDVYKGKLIKRIAAEKLILFPTHYAADMIIE
jgi:hypothetical protein